MALAGLGFVFFNVRDSLIDSAAASDISVSVFPTQLYLGEMVQINVTVASDTVINAVSVKLSSPTGADTILLNDISQGYQNVWQGTATIPTTAETGDWKVYFVKTTDTSGAVKTYYYDSINVVFSVLTPGTGSGGGEVSSCDFVYSDWSSCQNGVQTRLVVYYPPSTCGQMTPVLSQNCVLCTVTYSPWSDCVNGQQSRSIISKDPDGCTVEGLSLISTRSCTLCTQWEYSSWGECVSGIQKRTIIQALPAGCTGGQPEALTQSCESSDCQQDVWTCKEWGECTGGIQKRTCYMSFDCSGTASTPPEMEKNCTVSSVPTSTVSSTVACQYSYSDWSGCVEGKQIRSILKKWPDGCVEANKTETLERNCVSSCIYDYSSWSACSGGKKTRSVISSSPANCSGQPVTEADCAMPVCGLGDWTCGGWSVCDSIGKQFRACSHGSDCLPSSSVKPATEQICGTSSAALPVSSGTEKNVILPRIGDAGEVIEDQCVKVGIKDRKDCQWYLYRLRASKECLANNLSVRSECRQYFLAKYGRPLKCDGLTEEKCSSLIDNVILADLEDAIAPEVKQALAEISGNTAVIDSEKRILSASIGGTAEPNREVKVDNLPLAQSGGKFSVALVPTFSGEQGVLSPVAIGFDSNANGVPDDAESRFGSLPLADRTSITEEQLAGLSGVDRALIVGKTLEQPKLSSVSSSEILAVASVESISSETAGAGALRFQGKALPEQVVTLFVYSQVPIILTVKADENGNWIYDLDKTLIDGTHEVYAVINDGEGKIVETSLPTPFFIEEARAVTVDDFVRTQSAAAIPDQSANFVTFYLVAGGVFILLVVVAFLLFRKKVTE